ncbi:hypothetical protein [Nitrincola sp.]|uniref:hypothetical protein n=1 Tax=Nitrincola sp. TaxID=1926584 RepID=UPI003A8E8F9F
MARATGNGIADMRDFTGDSWTGVWFSPKRTEGLPIKHSLLNDTHVDDLHEVGYFLMAAGKL